MNRLSFFIIVIFLHLSFNMSAQNAGSYRFETLDNNNGLINNSVWAVEIDEFGFAWAATVDGLCRIETNNRLKTYRTEDYPFLTSNNIRTLKYDSQGNLWIGTKLDGVVVFNLRTDTWKNYRSNDVEPNSLVNDEILFIEEDSRGLIWIGTEDGFSIYDYKDNSFTNYSMQEDIEGALQNKAVLRIYEDNYERMWIGTWGSGLYLCLPQEQNDIKNLMFRQLLPDTSITRSYNVWSIFQDSEDRYWVGTYGTGFYNMELPNVNLIENKEWQPKFISVDRLDLDAIIDINISDITQDKNGNIWFSTLTGINHITADDIDILLDSNTDVEERRGLISLIEYQINHLDGLPSGEVRDLEIDNQGNLWIGTAGGVSTLSTNASFVSTTYVSRKYSNEVYGHNIIVQEGRKSWIPDKVHGMIRYNHEKKEQETYEELVGNPFTYDEIVSVSSNNNKLYLLSTNELIRVDLDNYQEKVYSFNKVSKAHLNTGETIFSTNFDSKGRFYICTTNGYIVKDLESNYEEIININNSNIIDNSVTQIYEDSEGNLWLGTFNGLSRMSKSSTEESTFINYKYPDVRITDNQIRCITEADKKIYFGHSSGLSCYDLRTDSFSTIGGKGENYNYFSLVNVGDHSLWGAVMGGIVSIDLKNGILRLYNEADGIMDKIFMPFGIDVGKEGNIYFTPKSKILEIDPSLIISNEEVPDVYITDIKVLSEDGERNYSGHSIEQLELKPQDYFVSFNFAANNFIQNTKNKYSYRLRGFEESWNQINDVSITSAAYTNLDPGDYVFEVRASNNDGVWNKEGVSLQVVSRPALIETLTFKILALLMLALLAIYAVKSYTNHVRRRAEEMKALVGERTQELAKKNEQVKDLLSKIQSRNVELEEIIAQRTQNLIEANNDLKRSNSDLEQFAYIASHDLQEPLRTVGTFASLLERKFNKELDNDSSECINFIVEGVKRMSNLINSILAYSKVGKEFNVIRSDMRITIDAKLKDLAKRIEEANAIINISKLPEINCDIHQIGMVFYNLINNGIKFNDKPVPIIDINFHDDEYFWKFSVRDNGIGIKEDYQSQIFELFTRLHLKSAYEGTGIGLSICERIISRHKGNIWLVSKLGEGSTFYFTISKNIEVLTKA